MSTGKPTESFFARHARELGLVVSILVLLAVPLLFGQGRGFYTASVFQGMVMDNLSVLIAAVGMTLVILCAEIDISIAAQLAVCGVVAGTLSRTGMPIMAVIPCTILCGALLGLVNGALVSWLSIPSIVATLAMWVLLENGLIVVTKGVWVQDLPDDFQWFGLGLGTGQNVFAAIAVATFILFAWILRKTEFGRRFYAVGCSHEASLRMRIHPRRIIPTAFVILGALIGLAAVIHYCRYPEIETGAGRGLELQVIAAVVVGGTAISGGRGSLIGTLLGVILMGVVTAVLAFTPLESTADKAVQGAIILIAVVTDKVVGKGKRGKETAT
jgi:rhamnose transport system permease protein